MSKLNNEMDIFSSAELALMPAEKLARLREDVAEQLHQLTLLSHALDRALDAKYGGQLDELRSQTGRDTGLFRWTDGNVTVIAEVGERYYWDQTKLAEIVERMRAEGYNPERYIDIEYRVPEHKRENWTPEMWAKFKYAYTDRRKKTSYRLQVK